MALPYMMQQQVTSPADSRAVDLGPVEGIQGLSRTVEELLLATEGQAELLLLRSTLDKVMMWSYYSA